MKISLVDPQISSIWPISGVQLKISLGRPLEMAQIDQIGPSRGVQTPLQGVQTPLRGAQTPPEGVRTPLQGGPQDPPWGPPQGGSPGGPRDPPPGGPGTPEGPNWPKPGLGVPDRPIWGWILQPLAPRRPPLRYGRLDAPSPSARCLMRMKHLQAKQGKCTTAYNP